MKATFLWFFKYRWVMKWVPSVVKMRRSGMRCCVPTKSSTWSSVSFHRCLAAANGDDDGCWSGCCCWACRSRFLKVKSLSEFIWKNRKNSWWFPYFSSPFYAQMIRLVRCWERRRMCMSWLVWHRSLIQKRTQWQMLSLLAASSWFINMNVLLKWRLLTSKEALHPTVSLRNSRMNSRIVSGVELGINYQNSTHFTLVSDSICGLQPLIDKNNTLLRKFFLNALVQVTKEVRERIKTKINSRSCTLPPSSAHARSISRVHGTLCLYWKSACIV